MTTEASFPPPPVSAAQPLQEGAEAPAGVESCLFCKIAMGSIPAAIEHQDNHCIAFRDISPAAPLHILIIPRQHIENVAQCSTDEQMMIGHLHLIAAQLARQYNVAASGYRLVLNNGAGAGQSVWHLHLHLLAGRAFAWPPG